MSATIPHLHLSDSTSSRSPDSQLKSVSETDVQKLKIHHQTHSREQGRMPRCRTLLPLQAMMEKSPKQPQFRGRQNNNADIFTQGREFLDFAEELRADRTIKPHSAVRRRAPTIDPAEERMGPVPSSGDTEDPLEHPTNSSNLVDEDYEDFPLAESNTPGPSGVLQPLATGSYPAPNSNSPRPTIAGDTTPADNIGNRAPAVPELAEEGTSTTEPTSTPDYAYDEVGGHSRYRRPYIASFDVGGTDLTREGPFNAIPTENPISNDSNDNAVPSFSNDDASFSNDNAVPSFSNDITTVVPDVIDAILNVGTPGNQNIVFENGNPNANQQVTGDESQQASEDTQLQSTGNDNGTRQAAGTNPTAGVPFTNDQAERQESSGVQINDATSLDTGVPLNITDEQLIQKMT
ncbi:hypothetical protein C7M84_018691 [Penaeus vannamei]|uniref:Uncharacterized protein n=1 Tax=Penaeus vannamei TaxID=6689 RepID=A0A423SGY1_PENVA|nr:hypothetical protein C7M84_018691 [Penaeus vannamei]